MYTTLDYSVDANGICWIKMIRPKQGNALVVPTGFDEMGEAFRQASDDPDAKVVIWCAEGKHFCAGGDIADMKRRLEEEIYISDQAVRDAGRTAKSIRLCKKPTIAMIQGACVGAGASMALACDFRIMADVAYLMTGFIQVACPGDTGGLLTLYQAVGLPKTLEYVMLGDKITAEECHRVGLAYKVTTLDDLKDVTLKLATRLANGPRLAYAYQKQVLWDIITQPRYGNYLEAECNSMVACGYSEDYTEAVHAFLEKRKPEFKGK